MKRLTIPGSGTESRATKPARVSAPATLGGAAFGASREDTGADLLEAAQAAETTVRQPGVLLLGCHLHGSMRGHVFVTDSAWTLKTDIDGIARFASVPDGAAQVRVWHAEQLVDLPRKALNVVPGPVLDTVQLGVVPRVRRAPPAAPAGPGTTPGGPMGSYSLAPVSAHPAHQHPGS